MIPLPACTLLTALSAQAKVVDEFKDCEEFFYQNTEPGGLIRIDQNLSGINEDQMSSSHSDTDIRPNQAINADYRDTGYDRGHLNPKSFQRGDAREATLTLTNAAPMDPCFNRVHWYQHEANTRRVLQQQLQLHPNADVYLVTGSQEKPCCSTPCLFQKDLNDYRCYSGQTLIACSPQYSAITVKGENCRDDHPCATYGEHYYWCYKASESWDFCSPPIWQSKAKNGKPCRSNHACAKYESEHPWCYTDDDNNWDECCTSDSQFSAVKGKSCKPSHPCGYHDEKYLWCRTTDGDWDYCCRDNA
ncbi:uncharacterized protein FYW47_002780 [Aplochiton taeniatus]